MRIFIIIAAAIFFIATGCKRKPEGPPRPNPCKKWKVGEVVRLKSGGPKMTVSDLTWWHRHCTVETKWIDQNGKREKADYNEHMLVREKAANACSTKPFSSKPVLELSDESANVESFDF
jgi:uncharacterized protein YodC (DUF2158 family)